MKRLFRNFLITAAIMLCGVVLYQVGINVFAGTSPVVYATWSVAYYYDTGYDVLVSLDTWAISTWDVINVWLAKTNNSGDIEFLLTWELTTGNFLGSPWTGRILMDFSSYTWSELYLHARVIDSGGTANWLPVTQQITFIKDVYKEIYGWIHDILIASGIDNNFDTVDDSNVTAFTDLYFAKLSWAVDELGRITFPIALDLTDTGVQTLLQNLWSGDVMSMNEGYVKFSPGAAAAMNTWATITMNFGTGYDFISGVNDPTSFIVRNDAGTGLTASDVISGITAAYADNSWYITFSANHFTDFTLFPHVTSLTIASSNAITGYATSWDVITIDVSFDIAPEDVDIELRAWNSTWAMTVTWIDKTRQATYTITEWDPGELTFRMVANYFSTKGLNIQPSETDITDWSHIVFDVTPITTWGTYTGDVFLAGATSTWYTSSTIWQLYSYASWSSDQINVDLSGLTIMVINGIWDWILFAPSTSAVANFGETWMPASSTNNGTTTTNRTILTTIQAGWASGVSLSVSPNFNIQFVVAGWTSGDVLKIFRSFNWSNWEANTPTTDATCTLDANKICSFFTDHLSYFTTIKETTSNNPSGGNGGGWSVAKDICPNGDTSVSFYDGKCTATDTTNGTPVKLWDITLSPFTDEINNAYLYAYNLGITSSPTILWADIEGKLIRSHMAKMMVNYAVKVMWLKPDTTKTCSFGDIENQNTELKEYIKLSCQLGLMWIGMTDFDPDVIVTRAQFGTILSRTLYDTQYEGGALYYTNHLAALKALWIMTKIDNAELINEIRWYVMLMLMRADR